MGVYAGTVLAGLVALLLLYYLLVAILGRMDPFTFIRKVAPVQLLAFSTSSSVAVMPVSIRTAEEKLRVDSSVSHVVVPLGTTINMAGTALYQSIALIFLAQVSGIQLSLSQMVLAVVMLVAASIGAPGTPGVGVIILGTIAANLGIPVEGMALILGFDRILDMCRTSVNVTGDLAACVILDRSMRPMRLAKAVQRVKGWFSFGGGRGSE
jgi:Na+/H+-dicarboxylate symporter